MGDSMFSGLKKAVACLLIALIAAPPSLAAELAHDYNYERQMTQQDAMGLGSNNYWNGSGDSKDEGVRNGMRAMGRLASLDIGGAIHYGYKGYGNYINSQKMDDLDARAWKKKDTMLSVTDNMISSPKGGQGRSMISGEVSQGADAVNKTANTGAGKSKHGERTAPSKKWRDMDRGFLFRGETAEVAAEFEKKTGMSREEFFEHVADAADAELSFDDPNLLTNLEARFERFKAGVRNPDFKSKLDKAQSMFSFLKKTEMLQEAAAFYNQHRGEGGPAEQLAASDAKAPNAALNAAVAEQRAPASAAAPLVVPQSNSDPRAAKLTKEQMGMYLGLAPTHGGELADILAGAEDTIFKVVSKRYRKLTPGLIGKAL